MNRKEESQNESEEQEQRRNDDEYGLTRDDKGKRVELVLKEKIALLETNCKFLKKKNEQLFEDLTDLQYQLQNYDLFTEEDAEENEAITAIEKEMQNVKTVVEELREKHTGIA